MGWMIKDGKCFTSLQHPDQLWGPSSLYAVDMTGSFHRKVTKGALFLHNNARAHWALATQKKLAYLGFQCLDHSPYSPDLAPSHYHLFPGLKKQLKGRHFSSNTEVTAAVETWLDRQPSEFFLSDLQKLEQQARKCIKLCGEYVE